MSRPIPNLNTLVDVIDRLIIDIHKLAWFENAKRQENQKKNPDAQLIQKYDNASRDCCEIRSALKNELNKMFREILGEDRYNPLTEVRTFAPAKRTVADILSDMCYTSANESFKKEFVEAIEKELKGK